MAAKKQKAAKPAEKRKRCPRCERAGRDPLRPLSEFPRNRSFADGLGRYCRACKRDADQERSRAPSAPTAEEPRAPPQHPSPEKMGDDRNSEPARARAPALAITDELIERAAELISTIGATRRAAARHVGVSENTFKSWLREGADLKDQDDPRARLLFAVEQAEGEAERLLTEAYFRGARIDPINAQRFLERRFSKGDEKWARTEHLTVSDGDAAPMEMTDARKLLADKLEKLLGARSAPPGDGGLPAGAPPGAADRAQPPTEVAEADEGAAEPAPS